MKSIHEVFRDAARVYISERWQLFTQSQDSYHRDKIVNTVVAIIDGKRRLFEIVIREGKGRSKTWDKTDGEEKSACQECKRIRDALKALCR